MKFLNKIDRLFHQLGEFIPGWALSLIMRFAIFKVFWSSAQLKIAGSTLLGQKWAFWNVKESTIMLFEYEYGLPLIPPVAAAYLATFSEFFLALGVLFGLLTRLSAFGLLFITLVIQVFVYWDAWPQHLLWAAVLLYLFKNGAGKLSIDSFFRKRS